MKRSTSSRRKAGFSLVEIMIVVAIIGLIAAMAIPAFSKSRGKSKVSIFSNSLRLATDAFELYAMENGPYPVEANPAAVPAGMAEYMPQRVDWANRAPIGGQWDWDNNVHGLDKAVSVIGDNLNEDRLRDVDALMDDGDLNTGVFRKTGATRYSYLLNM
jgi:type IV pilus assembly protein PilA